MFDIQRFDQWVAVNDDDEEANELKRVVVENMVLAGELLGEKVREAIAEEVVRVAVGDDRESYAGSEAHIYLDQGSSISAVEFVFDEVDLLEFKFARNANALKCYAMTGMIEGEEPTATFNEKRDHLSELLDWGRMVSDMIPEERTALPKFRSVIAAAEARWCIDLDCPVDTASFAHLAAYFREGTPDQVRKTLQNQISAKQLIVDERRALLPLSALQFLKGAPGFPSIWMLPDQPSSEAEELRDPIFIPVCPATSSLGERPFVPSEKHADGYHVGAGAAARTFEDYWQALDWLSLCAEPAFRPLDQIMPVRCKAEWMRVDRQQLQNELGSVAHAGAPSRSLTDQANQRLLTNSAVRAHPVGHTSKLFRYRLDNGAELALERRIGEPWLYFRKDGAPAVPSVAYSDVAGEKIGRHSNLDALPTFVGQPLRKFRLKSISDLDAVLSAL